MMLKIIHLTEQLLLNYVNSTVVLFKVEPILQKGLFLQYCSFKVTVEKKKKIWNYIQGWLH